MLITLITGASSGIGECFARTLAQQEQQTLVLVARRKDRLQVLADDLMAKHQIKVDVIDVDLQLPGAAEALMQEVKARGYSVDTLINNAGYGVADVFTNTEFAKITGMLQLNMTALTELMHLVVPEMQARKTGRVINIASVGAFFSAPRYAVYAATKAYVLSMTEALNYELKPDGIKVLAVCPGATKTEFHEVAGDQANKMANAMMDPVETVVNSSLKALRNGKAMVVTGLLNKPMPFFVRLMPRSMAVKVAAMFTAP